MGLRQLETAVTDPPADEASDCRCHCGSLLARIVEEGVEIRCRRCKRNRLVPWSARSGWVETALPTMQRAGTT